MVFGRRAGRTAAQEAGEERFVNLTPAVARDEADRIDALLSRSDRGIRAAALRRELGATMQEKAGIFRDAAGLSAGVDILHDLKDRYEDVSVQDRGSVFNTDLVSALGAGQHAGPRRGHDDEQPGTPREPGSPRKAGLPGTG